jgi:hypothetical protein
MRMKFVSFSMSFIAIVSDRIEFVRGDDTMIP